MFIYIYIPFSYHINNQLIDIIPLLCHIICAPIGDSITATKLREAVSDSKIALRGPRDIKKISEVLRVREKQEQLKREEIGKYCLLSVQL
jgi:hypothetical protein